MTHDLCDLEDTGLEVVDLGSDSAFAARNLHTYDAAMQLAALHRLADSFVENPEKILQQLVNAAIDLCGADSAGISIENKEEDGSSSYHWVATAGRYSSFLNAKLPSYPSACAVCLKRGKPQIFRVSKQFFDRMGIEADVVTDGLLIPWQVEEMRGTIWIMAHHRLEAFDNNDGYLMQSLANFAAMGVRQQRQQKALLAQARAAASAAMANELAHQINNPLQSLTNIFYLAAEGPSGGDIKVMAQDALGDLKRLSSLVEKLLTASAEG